MATTYHTCKGKFCKKDSAATVSKDGERYKVVRQHRRMKSGKKKAQKRVEEAVAQARWVPFGRLVRFG